MTAINPVHCPVCALMGKPHPGPCAMTTTQVPVCPCTTSAAPCRPRCTCIMPSSSAGCDRCAQYGSIEQRALAQAHLDGVDLLRLVPTDSDDLSRRRAAFRAAATWLYLKADTLTEGDLVPQQPTAGRGRRWWSWCLGGLLASAEIAGWSVVLLIAVVVVAAALR